MTPTERTLLRANALAILAPGSGVLRDQVREALAGLDAEAARAVNAPKDIPPISMVEAIRIARMHGYLPPEGAPKRISPVSLEDIAHTRSDRCHYDSDQPAPVRERRPRFVASAPATESDADPQAINIEITSLGDDEWFWRISNETGEGNVEGVAPSLADALAHVAEEVGRVAETSGDIMDRIRVEDRELLDALAAQPTDTVVAEVRAKFLSRSETGIAKYGTTLDRTDLGPREWLEHLQQELMDAVLYATRAMRDLPAAAPTEALQAAAPDIAGIEKATRIAALLDALVAVEGVAACDGESAPDYAGPVRELLCAAVGAELPRAVYVPLAPLAPEPAPAVLGRACEALNGSPPVYVMAGTGRHPYGDDAYWAEGRIFPNKDAANNWLRAMGKVTV